MKRGDLVELTTPVDMTHTVYSAGKVLEITAIMKADRYRPTMVSLADENGYHVISSMDVSRVKPL